MPADRVLATELGTKAIDMIVAKEFGYMAAIQKAKVVKVSLKEVAKGARTIPLDHPLIRSARSVGTCFGD